MLTYCGAEQLLPVGFEVKNHTPPGTWKGGPADEQHQKNEVGKRGSHPNDLNRRRQTFHAIGPNSLITASDL